MTKFQQKISPFEKFVVKYVFPNFLKFQFGTLIKNKHLFFFKGRVYSVLQEYTGTSQLLCRLGQTAHPMPIVRAQSAELRRQADFSEAHILSSKPFEK